MSNIKNLLYDYMEEMNISDFSDFNEREYLKFKIKYLTDSITSVDPMVIEFYESIFPHKTDYTRWIMLKSKDGFLSYGYDNLDDFICASNTFSKMSVDTYFSSAIYDGWYKTQNARYSKVLFLDIDGLGDIDLNNMNSSEIANWIKTTYAVPDEMLPNWAITSGHGLHLYYIVDELDYSNAEHNHLRDYYTKMLICYYKGDRICKNKNHILRLPYSFNCKHDLIQTKLHHLNKLPDTNISRLDYFFCSEDKLAAYDEVCKSNRKENNTSNKEINNIEPKPRQESKLKSYDTDFITPPSSLKYFDDFRRNARYTNIIKDLHNYYVRHKGHIDGHRNIFMHILASFLKLSHKSLEEALDYIEVYCTVSFLAEAQEVVQKVYNEDTVYRYHNDSIAELLDFTKDDCSQSYCCYSDEDRVNRRRFTNRRAKNKQLKAKREQSKLFHDNLKNYIIEHPETSCKEIAIYFGVSTRTVQRYRKALK